MLVRQTLPLIIAYVNDREAVAGRTRFQKMIFVLQEEIQSFKERYEFVPHDFGPYSPELQNDIDDLIAKEFLQEIRHTVEEGKIKFIYQITERGISVVQTILANQDLENKYEFSRIIETAATIKNDLNSKHLPLLLSDIYQKYPDFAKFSIFSFS